MSEASKKLNFILILSLLSIILIAVSCGSSDSNFTSTNLNNTPSTFTNTPTPALTYKPISGYLYISNTSLEDGENITNTTVLDIPAVNPDSSGSTPLLTQISNLQQENPDDWNSPDIKELYDKLSTTLNQSQALPQTAKIFTKYQDSLNESPIPVNNEGFMSGQAVINDGDTNVELEISLDEDNYIEAETVIASDNLTSSDATEATLKSCPEKIISFPGEITILKIYSTINLEKAGLTVTLNNSGLGCLSRPVFLDVCSKKKQDTAYIFFYPKKNLSTPIDTKITARTDTGLQLEIFTEIIKSTTSISGRVFTGGKPLIKGYVRSIGPKAFCKLDSSGNYTLPRVFRGHFRKVTATYWIEDNNGKKIRHREEKIIDFFNSDLTNFNFGEELLTPTPTLTPTAAPTPREVTDPFYADTAISVMLQRDLWIKDLEIDQALQKTVQWLNGNISDYPPPEGIASAELDADEPTIIWITFTDGNSRCIHYYPMIVENSQTSVPIQRNLRDNPNTVGSDKVKILAPFAWQDEYTNQSVQGAIWDKLVAPSAEYDKRGSIRKLTLRNDIEKSFALRYAKYFTEDSVITIKEALHITNPDDSKSSSLAHLLEENNKFETISDLKNNLWMRVFTPDEINIIWANMETYTCYKMICHIKNYANIIQPEDFQDLADYGIIYITTHGYPDGIACGPMYPENIGYLKDHNWLNKSEKYSKLQDTGIWSIDIVTVWDPEAPGSYPSVIEVYELHREFFQKCANRDFSKSLIYINACHSYTFINSERNYNPMSDAKAYLGYDKFAGNNWARNISYYFFLYMIDSYKIPVEIFPSEDKNAIINPVPLPSSEPMSAQQAYKIFSEVRCTNKLPPYNLANPDPHDYSDPIKYPNKELLKAQNCVLKLEYKEPDIYFPVPVTITIEKK